MKRLSTILAFALLASTVAFAQVEFRNPEINAAEPDGALAYGAATTVDLERRIATLDDFLGQYADSTYRPHVLYMMLVAATEGEQPEKAAAAGQELVEIVGDDVEVRVWDSSAEVRYLVLPQQPAGSDGKSEDELAAMVTRDGMIGTALV